MKKYEKQILELFQEYRRLKFNKIEKLLEIRSNKLSYYLTSLKKQNILTKDNNYWKLSKETEKLIPFLKHLTGEEVGQLGVVLLAITKQSEILLLNRKTRPYKNYWSLIGGKIKVNETIKEATINTAKREINLNVKFNKIAAVIQERLKENNEIKHGFIFFLVKLTPSTMEINNENLKWFSLNRLPKQIIPSDRWMINNLLNKKSKIYEVLMREKEGKLGFFKFKSYFP